MELGWALTITTTLQPRGGTPSLTGSGKLATGKEDHIEHHDDKDMPDELVVEVLNRAINLIEAVIRTIELFEI